MFFIGLILGLISIHSISLIRERFRKQLKNEVVNDLSLSYSFHNPPRSLFYQTEVDKIEQERYTVVDKREKEESNKLQAEWTNRCKDCLYDWNCEIDGTILSFKKKKECLTCLKETSKKLEQITLEKMWQERCLTCEYAVHRENRTGYQILDNFFKRSECIYCYKKRIEQEEILNKANSSLIKKNGNYFLHIVPANYKTTGKKACP